MSTDLAKYGQHRTGLQQEHSHVAIACAEAMSLEVVDQPSYDMAVEACQYIKACIKELETRRKAVTGPLLEVKREIDSWFKPVVSQWQAAETDLKRKMLDHARTVREANTEAQKAAAEASTPEEAVTALETIVAKPQTKGASTVRRWTYELIDLESVPVHYTTVDDAEVKAAIKNGERDIPGLRIYQTETIAIR